MTRKLQKLILSTNDVLITEANLSTNDLLITENNFINRVHDNLVKDTCSLFGRRSRGSSPGRHKK